MRLVSSYDRESLVSMTTLPTSHQGWFRGIISDAPRQEARPVPWTLTDILIGIAANVGFAVLLYRIADMLGLEA